MTISWDDFTVDCRNESEPDGMPCPGQVTFGPGAADAACDFCGARTGRQSWDVLPQLKHLRIVEPVILRQAMKWTTGDPREREYTEIRRFDDYAEARRRAVQATTLNGTVWLDIIGADGAPLLSYHRSDNHLYQRAAGELVVTELARHCSCGGVPSVRMDVPRHLVHEPTMGWHWSCDRCGGWTWSRVEPRADGS